MVGRSEEWENFQLECECRCRTWVPDSFCKSLPRSQTKNLRVYFLIYDSDLLIWKSGCVVARQIVQIVNYHTFRSTVVSCTVAVAAEIVLADCAPMHPGSKHSSLPIGNIGQNSGSCLSKRSTTYLLIPFWPDFNTGVYMSTYRAYLPNHNIIFLCSSDGWCKTTNMLPFSSSENYIIKVTNHYKFRHLSKKYTLSHSDFKCFVIIIIWALFLIYCVLFVFCCSFILMYVHHLGQLLF